MVQNLDYVLLRLNVWLKSWQPKHPVLSDGSLYRLDGLKLPATSPIRGRNYINDGSNIPATMADFDRLNDGSKNLK